MIADLSHGVRRTAAAPEGLRRQETGKCLASTNARLSEPVKWTRLLVPAAVRDSVGVNMNESGQIGAGLALETRYRTID
jgi:hypothetical protein